jgi:hypothetical protein
MKPLNTARAFVEWALARLPQREPFHIWEALAEFEALAAPCAVSADRLLYEVFSVCEATEDECHGSSEEFKRGRAYEAKRIRRSVGTWFQDESK